MDQPAKKSKKPARIPPQTPPARGQMQKQKSAEVLPNPFPQKIVLAKLSLHFAPPHCLNTWKAEPQKVKCLELSVGTPIVWHAILWTADR
ncbi:MAG: hypothetical protein AUJ23_00265 [Candidatus Magasanikbacteria bacterium CG1_02_32_51]|uniref:Uncharacterized protein n=1 Tax=Candidatus Magasanikbacteria bacterium CG1_02_32_51 TaxID=1805238 RepID=A0A1J4U790_9BACT|nr:MAG: hypothetical protein AUJ23_00265 [Candidatus Magasanikbacteria bacterium CG1_02_32_51]